MMPRDATAGCARLIRSRLDIQHLDLASLFDNHTDRQS